MRLARPPKSRSAWLNAVLKRMLRALVIGTLYAVIAAPLIYRAFNSPVRGLRHPSTLLSGSGEDGIIVTGGITQIDFTGLQMTITWSLLACGATYCSYCNTETPCGVLSRPVAIFMDNNATRASQSGQYFDISTSAATQEPLYGYDPTLWSLNDHAYTSRRVNTQTFKSQQPIDLAHRIYTRTTTGHSFPTDDYITSAAFYLLYTDTNETLPISSIAVYVLTQDAWIVSSNTYSLLDPKNNSTSNNTTRSAIPGVLGVTASVRRPKALVTFVIGAVFAVNWCIALVTALLTVWVLFLRNPDPAKKKHYMSLETLCLVPITALFSMPQLRAVISFIPIGNGSDASGFLPCLVVVALCTALMLGYLVMQTAGRSLIAFATDIVDTFVHSKQCRKNSSLPTPPSASVDSPDTAVERTVVESPLKLEEGGVGMKSMEQQQAAHLADLGAHRRLSSAVTIVERQQGPSGVASESGSNA